MGIVQPLIRGRHHRHAEAAWLDPNDHPGCITTDWVETPLGLLLVAATARGVCLAEFTEPDATESQLALLRKYFGCNIVSGSHQHLEQLKTELSEYFAGSLTKFRVPLVYPGSPFQRQVWHRLCHIPYGETLSYQALARDLGAPEAQRAVGRATGQNRIAIVIPCHRVINKNGRIGGYGGGRWRKVFLLDLEQQVSKSCLNHCLHRA